MLIEYYQVKQPFGRIDSYPVDDEVLEAMKLITGKFSGSMNQNVMEGLQKLGHQLKNTTPSISEEG